MRAQWRHHVPSMRAHWRHLANTIECASFGPPESTTETSNRSVQSFFAGLTTLTDRPTDHATRPVTIGRIYVHSTAMRPNNNNRHHHSHHHYHHLHKVPKASATEHGRMSPSRLENIQCIVFFCP